MARTDDRIDDAGGRSAIGHSDQALRTMLRSVKTIAMVGASPKPLRPAHGVMKFLLSRGYRVIPVNPGHAEILGQIAYPRIGDIPEQIDLVDIFRRREAIAGIVDEALALATPPRVIWMQLGLRDDAAASRAEARGLTVIANRCIKIEYLRLLE